MKPAVFLAPVLAVTVGALIWAEFAERPRLVYVFKPLSTLLVIAACALAFLDPAHNPTYTLGVLVGLGLSLGGDVALMFHDSRRAFLVGLVLFLLAHVAYTVVFTALGRSSGWDIVSGAVLLAAGAGFYALIRPNLGAMRVPVLAYMVVISVMVNRAVSALASPCSARAGGDGGGRGGAILRVRRHSGGGALLEAVAVSPHQPGVLLRGAVPHRAGGELLRIAAWRAARDYAPHGSRAGCVGFGMQSPVLRASRLGLTGRQSTYILEIYTLERG